MMHITLCSLLFFGRPKVHGILVGMEVKDSLQCGAGFFASFSRHLSHSVLADVECQGGGVAGSLTPR